MIRNKKGDVWFWVVSGAIAVAVLLITWVIVGKSLAGSKLNLDTYQDCELRKGQCVAKESDCKPGETAYYKTLGCGDEKRKNREYCCLPPI